MTDKVKALVNEIREGLSQTSSSQKDELRVMRTMLNDRDYKVGVYGKEGKVGEYCPAEDARTLAASLISSTAKIPAAEAAKLAENHEFSKAEAGAMIDISKEFVNTFLQTGRKLPLGGREKSNVSLAIKDVDATVRTYPKKVGVNNDGTSRFGKGEVSVNAHQSVRVFAPCPPWVDGKK